MGFILAITGAIGSGKTTLASRIAAERTALHLSSDEVRLSLSHKQRRSGEKVFAELHRRFEQARRQGRGVVLDSSGMSPRFRALLRAHRHELVHVHLLLRSIERFEQREAQRADRPAGPLPRSAFHRSRAVEFHDAPDVVVATDDLTPAEVYTRVELALGRGAP